MRKTVRSRLCTTAQTKYMKTLDKNTISFVPAGILVLIGVFARPLGFSATTGLIIFVTALVFLLLGYREMIKGREPGCGKHQAADTKSQPLQSSALQQHGAGGGEPKATPVK